MSRRRDWRARAAAPRLRRRVRRLLPTARFRPQRSRYAYAIRALMRLGAVRQKLRIHLVETVQRTADRTHAVAEIGVRSRPAPVKREPFSWSDRGFTWPDRRPRPPALLRMRPRRRRARLRRRRQPRPGRAAHDRALRQLYRRRLSPSRRGPRAGYPRGRSRCGAAKSPYEFLRGARPAL